MERGQSNYRNAILRALPASAFARLSPHLEQVHLPVGSTLQEADAPIVHSYFVDSGLVSLMVPLMEGQTAEAAVAGSEGLVSPDVITSRAPSRVVAVQQLPGTIYRVPSSTLRAVAAEGPELVRTISRYTLLLFEAAAQTAACNATHQVENRLARWLLTAQSYSGLSELALTHEFLAQMLAVRRPSVTTSAIALQREGLIQYSRARVTIIDQRGLRQKACECHDRVAALRRDYLADVARI